MPIHVDHVLNRDQLPPDCIAECSASGDVLPAVIFWCVRLGFTVDRIAAVQCLGGSGAWDDDELAAMDADEIAERILWLACCAFREGDDLFVLE